MTWREMWERNFGRDWRQDVAQHRTLEELTDEFEEAVDRVQERLLRIWGPQILEESDEG